MTEVKNRSEIVFLYDIKDANPNGDPMDENKPRIDEETGINIVTDVRLKRTIRDYLHNFQDKEIFVREIEYEPGKIQDAKLRIEDFLKNDSGEKLDKEKLDLGQIKDIMGKNVINDCVDVRLFGATIPVEKSEREKSSITLIGPVQFRFGRSLHQVEVVHIKGTGAFASGKEMEQKTFREEYILPYSLICFYGIINENAAKSTNLTEEDVDLLLDGIWNGTKNLITRSKIGQIPRFLLRIIYKEKNYHIGDLDKKMKLVYSKNNEKVSDGKEIRNISEVKVDITPLISALKENIDKIEKIQYDVNTDVVFLVDGDDVKGAAIEKNLRLDDITVEQLNLE
jgi:CRISPR-associated protein Csh2